MNDNTGKGTPLNITAGDMLRHVAEELDGGDPDMPIVAVAVVVLRGDGQWSAMASPQLQPFVGSALLDHAKIDLIMGGSRWTEFQPKAASTPLRVVE